MAWLALAVYLVGLVTAFGLRTWLHNRSTGDSGHRHNEPPVGSAGWWGQLLLGVALLLGAVAPALDALAVINPPAVLDRRPLQLTGLVVALAGFVAVALCQSAMGSSWRVGVDPAERTELVTGGPFRLVRNPIFTAMIVAMLGLTAMTATWLQAAVVVCMIVGLELHVRAVEEPYLVRLHGSDYLDYARKVGRFVPGLGRHPR